MAFWNFCDYRQKIEHLHLAFTPVGETEAGRMWVHHRPAALGNV